ncbi:MAG: carboxypeptidase-like regulatory domain-containing protein [Chitinophagales bacterium]
MKRFIAILLLNSAFLLANAQSVVQFSGFVRDAESNSPVPFCAVYVDGQNRGAITSLEGFFTFPAAKSDTILIKALGYKTFTVVIPTDLELASFTKEVTLERDVIQLPPVDIRPLPTENQLRQAMINLDVPNNMQDLAQKTIEQSILTDEISKNTNFSGKENFNQYVQNQVGYYYNRYGGQHSGISLTNPFAWANFIKDIKAKKKKKK